MSLHRTADLRACTALGFGLALGLGAGLGADETIVELPADALFQSSPDSPGPVAFRHWIHVAVEGGRCDGCHTRLFSILAPQRSQRHEEMDAAGQGCGACHDGSRAFSTQDDVACLSCHGDGSPLAPLPPAPARLLGVSTLASSGDSPGAVRFDHGAHLAGGAVCSTCHPALAGMSAPGRPASKDQMLAGAGCGACHDGERAFGVDDDRCELCHDTGEDQP